MKMSEGWVRREGRKEGEREGRGERKGGRDRLSGE